MSRAGKHHLLYSPQHTYHTHTLVRVMQQNLHGAYGKCPPQKLKTQMYLVSFQLNSSIHTHTKFYLSHPAASHRLLASSGLCLYHHAKFLKKLSVDTIKLFLSLQCQCRYTWDRGKLKSINNKNSQLFHPRNTFMKIFASFLF